MVIVMVLSQIKYGVDARKMKNAKQSLEARLSNVFGDKPGKAVFHEISKFL